MNRIIFPLKSKMRGDPVTNLHDGLRLMLDKDVFQLSEVDRKTFQTRLAVERNPEAIR